MEPGWAGDSRDKILKHSLVICEPRPFPSHTLFFPFVFLHCDFPVWHGFGVHGSRFGGPDLLGPHFFPSLYLAGQLNCVFFLFFFTFLQALYASESKLENKKKTNKPKHPLACKGMHIWNRVLLWFWRGWYSLGVKSWCAAAALYARPPMEVCGKTFINIPFMTSVLCPQWRRAYICLSHLSRAWERYVCQCVCVCERDREAGKERAAGKRDETQLADTT